MELEVTGIKEVREQLRDMVEQVTKALPEAMLESVSIIEASAKEKAPVRTGALRDSIISDVEETTTEVSVEVGPTIDYADDVEFGGVRRAAKPYLRPSIDELEDTVLEVLASELDKVVEEI